MSDQQPVFSIEKIYVRDLSLEVPHAPQIYMATDAPQLEVQLAQAVNAVVSNTTEMTINDTLPIMQLIKSGRLRALAVTTTKRISIDPSIPTLAESGMPGYNMVLYIGLFAPAGTPAEIVGKLSNQVMRIVQMPDTREKMAKLGVEPVGSTATELGDAVKADIAKFREVVKVGNLKP